MPPAKTDPTPPESREADVEVAKIQGDESEFARHPAENTDQLSADIGEHGLLQPIALTEDFRIVFGHGRFLAVKKLGWKTIRARIFTKALTRLQFRLIRASENLQRTDYTPYQKWQLCVQLLEVNGAWDQAMLAAHLHLSQPTICRLLAPSKLSMAWQEALKTEAVTLSHCYSASRADKSKHEGLLALALNKAPREELDKAAKPARKKGKAARMSKLQLALPDGVSLTVAAKSLTLDDLIGVFASLHREAEAAKQQKLDASAFQAVLKSKSRVG